MKHLLILFLFLTVLLSGCGPDGEAGRYELVLNDSIFNQLQDRVQLNMDTILGDSANIAYDTLQRNYILNRLRGNRFARYYNGVDTLVIASLDSLPGQDNVVRLTNNHRVRVEIPASDVVLNGDSIRLGIMHIFGSAFSWREDSYVPDPDHLVITSWGRDHLPFAMDQDNIGPITRQTVFRIGRHHYYIESIDDARRRVVIRELRNPGNLSATAELDLTFKRVSVKGLDGKKATVGARKGRKFALYFWSLGSRPGGTDIIKLDSLYRALPPEEQDKIDIVLVNRTDEIGAVRRFAAKNELELPVYLAAENTCRKLNCRPGIPYWIGVNERGKVTSFYNEADWLVDSLEVP